MMYFAILLLIATTSVVTNKKECNILFTCFFIFISALSIFRFGLGTDYFSYYNLFTNYFSVNSLSDLSIQNYILSEVEPIFYLFEFVFKLLKIPFTGFIAFCSLLSLIFIYAAMKKCSKNLLLSLFVFYANYFLIVVWSMVRQGIAMSIIAYAVADFLNSKNKKKYVISIILAMGFHFTAIIGLIVLIAPELPYKWFSNYYYCIFFSIFALFCGFVLINIAFSLVILILPRYKYYKPSFGDFNTLGFCFRAVELILVLSMRKYIRDDKDKKLYKIFVCGIYISFICMSNNTFTRFTEYFISLEIFLIPNLISNMKKAKSLYLLVFFVLYSFLFTKDLSATKSQMGFKSYTKLYEYPYVNVFNKDKIKEIRKSHDYKGYELYFKNVDLNIK